MKKKSLKTNYESFHKNTTFQKKLIQENNFTYRHILKTINEYLDSPKQIFDIGCGAGTLDLYYADKNNSVLGIDISIHAIEQAKKSAKYLKLKNVNFAVMDFPHKIPKKKFDFIICSEVIEHLEDDNLAFKQMYNALKPNGIAFISTPSKNAPLYRLGLANAFDKRVGHLRRYTLQELVKKTSKCGFKVIETQKTEGILRNFLFLNPVAGKLVRYMKFFIADIVTLIDQTTIPLFGESNLFIVIKKNK